MKTRQEVEELKENWCSDNIWDIETTEGFEKYKEELKLFRELYEARMNHSKVSSSLWDRINAKDKLVSGIIELMGKTKTENYFLAEFIYMMNQRLRQVENDLEKMEKKNNVSED